VQPTNPTGADLGGVTIWGRFVPRPEDDFNPNPNPHSSASGVGATQIVHSCPMVLISLCNYMLITTLVRAGCIAMTTTILCHQFFDTGQCCYNLYAVSSVLTPTQMYK